MSLSATFAYGVNSANVCALFVRDSDSKAWNPLAVGGAAYEDLATVVLYGTNGACVAGTQAGSTRTYSASITSGDDSSHTVYWFDSATPAWPNWLGVGSCGPQSADVQAVDGTADKATQLAAAIGTAVVSADLSAASQHLIARIHHVGAATVRFADGSMADDLGSGIGPSVAKQLAASALALTEVAGGVLVLGPSTFAEALSGGSTHAISGHSRESTIIAPATGVALTWSTGVGLRLENLWLSSADNYGANILALAGALECERVRFETASTSASSAALSAAVGVDSKQSPAIFRNCEFIAPGANAYWPEDAGRLYVNACSFVGKIGLGAGPTGAWQIFDSTIRVGWDSEVTPATGNGFKGIVMDSNGLLLLHNVLIDVGGTTAGNVGIATKQLGSPAAPTLLITGSSTIRTAVGADYAIDLQYGGTAYIARSVQVDPAKCRGNVYFLDDPDVATLVSTLGTPAGASLAADIDALPTAAENAAAVAAQPRGTVADSIGKGISDILEDTGTTLPASIAALPAAIWAVLTSALTAAGTMGKWLLDQITAIKTKTDTIGVAITPYTGPVSAAGDTITVTRGDCYLAAHGRALSWDLSDWPVTVGQVVTLTIRDRTTDAVLVTSASTVAADESASFDLTSADTDELPTGTHAARFDVEVTLGAGQYLTPIVGYVSITGDETRH